VAVRADLSLQHTVDRYILEEANGGVPVVLDISVGLMPTKAYMADNFFDMYVGNQPIIAACCGRWPPIAYFCGLDTPVMRKCCLVNAAQRWQLAWPVLHAHVSTPCLTVHSCDRTGQGETVSLPRIHVLVPICSAFGADVSVSRGSIKETMKIMGLKPVVIDMSWFLAMAIQMVITSIALSIIISHVRAIYPPLVLRLW
jgi:hypothetical protein